MPVIWNDTVSGSGSEEWADIEVDYVLIDILDIGTVTRRLELNDPDHILRFGWFSFLRVEDPFGEPRNYWRPPVWIDFEHMYWTPIPAYSAGITGDLAIWTQGIRWSIAPGGSMHIEVGNY